MARQLRAFNTLPEDPSLNIHIEELTTAIPPTPGRFKTSGL